MELEALREELDRIDGNIVNLFQERMRLSARIGEAKAGLGRPVRDPDREEEKLRMVSQAADPEFACCVRELYLELMRLSRTYQEEMRRHVRTDETEEH